MAFKASKVRQRRKKQVAEGTQLIPNAAIEEKYRAGLETLVGRMVDDYRKELKGVFTHPDVKEHYSEDASPTSMFKRILGRLDRKWRGVFASFAKRHVDQFVSKSNEYSEFSVKHSLKTLGLEQPKSVATSNLVQTLQASIQENVALITNIQEKFAKEIEGSVYRSIASDDPKSNGSDVVMQQLMEQGQMTKRRAQLIAEDQNSKLYSNLTSERMAQNGVDKFKWKHSSRGKYPRASHIAREKQDIGYGPGIFKLNSPELWEGPKADQGRPGEAIRCACRMIPVLNLD